PPSLTLAGVPTPCSRFPYTTLFRSYTATDVCGNSSSATQTITVDDQTAPTITSIPANTTVNCAAAVPPANDAAVVATDNCTGTPDRKSTRLNSSHVETTYAAFCLNK